jgi:phosphoserine phosphatase
VREVAIYDLDGTVLRRSSFTPFLFFAASRHERWRLCLAPVWITAMGLYKLGFFSRGALKQFGLRLFLGRRMTGAKLRSLSLAFADRILPAWLAPGAVQAMASDRAEGRSLVLATAAMEFYAGELGRRLRFDHVIASRSKPLSEDFSACSMEGENCYGSEKPERVATLFRELGWNRSECSIRFYTDSASDAPLLDWADQPILVNGSARARRTARARGWETRRF